MNNSIKVKDNIYWVGTLDYDIRTFDVIMYTEYGTTYNAYIVKGKEKTAIIEASKDKFFEQYLQRIRTITEPEKIDYLIVDHTEPDHTGSVEMLLKINPEITIVGSISAIKFLKEITNIKFKSIVANDNTIIDLGGKTLKFIMAPFLHWPDSMYTYLEEDKILFTCDSFGCHYCNEKLFNDEIKENFDDAYKYYFDCIMGPFKEYVQKAVNKIENLKIDIICPGHGPILRTELDKYIGLYKEWSLIEKNNSIVVCYVSAYGYTKKIAEKIVEGIKSEKVSVKVFDLEKDNVSEVLKEIYVSKGILVGSPTIVADTLPPIWDLISKLNPFINKGLMAGVFGSYGWSGEAVSNIEQRFSQLKFKMPLESLKILFNPSNEQLKEAFDFGKKFAEQFK